MMCWMRSACLRIAWVARSARSSSRTRASSCSARPTMTPSGVETSCAMPMANVPIVAARSARARSSSSCRCTSATASSRSSSSSLRCLRSAAPPKASTSPEASSRLRTSLHSARFSRSRSRPADATDTTVQRPRSPASRCAMPATDVRGGSPMAADCECVRRSVESPRSIAETSSRVARTRPSTACSTVSWGASTSSSSSPGCTIRRASIRSSARTPKSTTRSCSIGNVRSIREGSAACVLGSPAWRTTTGV